MSNIWKLYESVILEGKHFEDYRKTVRDIIDKIEAKNPHVFDIFSPEKITSSLMDAVEPLQKHISSNANLVTAVAKWLSQYAIAKKNDENAVYDFLEGGILAKLMLYLGTKFGKNLKGLTQKEQSSRKADKDRLTKMDIFTVLEEIDKENAENAIDTTVFFRNIGKDKQFDVEPVYDFYDLEDIEDMLTGDGTYSNRWCHATDPETYSKWLRKEPSMFFIVKLKDPNSLKDSDYKTSEAYDEFGVSMIACLFSTTSKKLLKATLRWNHLKTPSIGMEVRDVDNAIKTNKELEALIGHDAMEKIYWFIDHSSGEFYKKILEQIEATGEIEPAQNDIIRNLKLDIFKVPENCKKIDGFAFWNCQGIQKIIIPEGSVEEIESMAFSDCSVKDLELPDSVKKIGRGAFDGASLESIRLPENRDFKILQDSTFRACQNLKSINIPDSVEKIEDECFMFCKSLSSVKLPKKCKIGARVFKMCQRLKSIFIPVDCNLSHSDTFEDSGLEEIRTPKKNMKALVAHLKSTGITNSMLMGRDKQVKVVSAND